MVFGVASGLDKMQDFRLVAQPGLTFLRLTGSTGMGKEHESHSSITTIRRVSLGALKLLTALELSGVYGYYTD